MSLILPGGPQFSLFDTSTFPGSPSADIGGVTVSNPAGGANTKNTTWTQLIASTAFDAQLVIITVASSSAAATDTSTLLDIGIGAAASETVIIPDLLAGSTGFGTALGGRHYIFPLYIPSGSRLSARTQSVRTTGSVLVGIQLYGGPKNPDRWWCGTQVTAYGINTADSGGTAVTAGNSGSEGTVTSIGTTTSDHECILFGAQLYGTVVNNLAYHYDVGIETSSTAWLVQDGFYIRTDSSERLGSVGAVWWPILAHVPSGSVLAAAGECGGPADAAIDIALYGVS